jgi:hypothetical protein
MATRITRWDPSVVEGTVSFERSVIGRWVPLSDAQALEAERDELRRKLDEAVRRRDVEAEKADTMLRRVHHLSCEGAETEGWTQSLDRALARATAAESRADRAEKALRETREAMARVQTYLLCIVPTSNESGYVGMARDLLRDTLATTPDALAPKAMEAAKEEAEVERPCDRCVHEFSPINGMVATKARAVVKEGAR